MSHGSDSVKAILYALGANAAIAISKLGAAIITGSGSMLAEAVHSFADCGNQLLLLIGLKRAARPPSPDYPLGYGKETYFWSFIVALMLFSLGGVFSIYEGWHKLHTPEALSYPWLALGVLTFGVIMESISMWGCLREVNKARGRQSLWQWFKHTREAELLVIFGEDFAALIGLTVALLAVMLTMITGNPIYDAAGGVVIGVLLLAVAIFVGIEVKDLLIGQSAEPREVAAMRKFLRERPEIAELYSLLTMQMGKDIMVAVKANMRERESATALITAINIVEKEFKAQFPQVLWLFFEPDIKD